MSASWPADVDMLAVVGEWIRSRRWFPAGDLDPMELVANVDLSADSAPEGQDPATPLDPVWISLVRVGPQLLQVPLVLTDVAPPGGRGVITRLGDAWVVDGPQHPAFLRAWARRSVPDTLDEGGTPGVDPRADLAAQADGARPLTGEQSNTSILLAGGTPAVLKVFRIVSPGTHPDLEVPLALERQGWDHVPEVLAHSALDLPPSPEAEDRRPAPAVTGIAARLVPGARDGFDFFVDLARRGVDPTGPARDLGSVTASMHEHLARAFGVGTPARASTLADRVAVNVEAAAAEVFDLAPLVPGLEALLAPLADLGELPPPIRIHGDYHLGQTLLGEGRWYVLDFEGEPLRPLAVRRRPDLAMRDVAGMLRSFDYAAAQAGRTPSLVRPGAGSTAEMPPLDGTQPPVTFDREWARTARDAFVAGYTDDHGLDDPLRLVLRALVVEKAAYELVYEHRLRPSWMPIPRSALVDLARGAS